MKQRPQPITRRRRSRRDHPVLVKEGISDDVMATIFPRDIRERKGEGVLAVLKDRRRSAAEFFARFREERVRGFFRQIQVFSRPTHGRAEEKDQ